MSGSHTHTDSQAVWDGTSRYDPPAFTLDAPSCPLAEPISAPFFATSPVTTTDVGFTPEPLPLRPKKKPVVLMPEIPSVLEKRGKGGPGKKRSGISPEEKAARQQERVLRNRIAAQESRTRKRAYLETLETATSELMEKNEKLESDNEQLHKRIRLLEDENRLLHAKLDWVMQQLGSSPSLPPIASPSPASTQPAPPTQPNSSAPLNPHNPPTKANANTTPLTFPPPSVSDPKSLSGCPVAPSAPAATIAGQSSAPNVVVESKPKGDLSPSTSTLPHNSTTAIPHSEFIPMFLAAGGFSGPAAAEKLAFLANTQQRCPPGLARIFGAMFLGTLLSCLMSMRSLACLQLFSTHPSLNTQAMSAWVWSVAARHRASFGNDAEFGVWVHRLLQLSYSARLATPPVMTRVRPSAASRLHRMRASLRRWALRRPP